MDDDALAAAFEAQRPRLVAVAERMLGTRADAEDAVQEAWLRLARQEAVDNVAAWLTTVVGRICLDVLRSRKARPEVSADDRPDFLVTEVDAEPSPEDQAVLADSVGLALLVVLDQLQPAERLAFVLHDLFAVPFAEIGPVLSRSEDATKMLASRARRKVRGTELPPEDRHRQLAVVAAFLDAARAGNFTRLLELLDPEVTWRHHTARGVRTFTGAPEVLRRMESGARSGGVRARVVLVDGGPGVVFSTDGRPTGVMACTVVDGRIAAVDSLGDPERVAAVTSGLARPS